MYIYVHISMTGVGQPPSSIGTGEVPSCSIFSDRHPIRRELGARRRAGNAGQAVMTSSKSKQLVGGLEHFLFFHILGIIIPIDYYFSEG